MYTLVLPFLHLHHVKQYGFAAKSVFEYSVVFLNKPQNMRFIYMTTILLMQTEVVTDWPLKLFLTGFTKYTGVTADWR